ncbi:MAG: hypothetical protein ACRCW0_01445 [Clostridium sp.]
MGKLNINNTTNNITKGGIYVALSIVILYLTALIPFNTIFILGVASAIIPLSILTVGYKSTIIVYIATSLLSYFLIPSKSIWLIYVLFFGIYGLIKFLIEGLKKLYLELVLKFIFFNTCCVSFYFLATTLFTSKEQLLELFNAKPSMIIIFILLYEVGFFIYDYALTAFISYLNAKVLKHL